jgi:hypothetical protein
MRSRNAANLPRAEDHSEKKFAAFQVDFECLAMADREGFKKSSQNGLTRGGGSR